MKKTTLLSLLILSLHAFAQQENPALFCTQTDQCTDQMLAITRGYSEGNANFSQAPLAAISGACYHISSAYDRNHEHHGGFVFERRGKDLFTAGEFSFFADEDPYQHLNSLEMKEYFVKANSRFEKTMENPTQIELQYLTSRSDLHYWFRSSQDGKKVYMIAKQAIEDYLGFIFCETNVH
jgi:hypothetical protein